MQPPATPSPAPIPTGRCGDPHVNLDAAFLRNPYPTYRALREAGRVHWSEAFFGGAWLLTHHDDIDRVLRDERFSAQRTGGWVLHDEAAQCDEAARRELSRFQQVFSRALLFLDAPDHTRVRRVLEPGFKPAALRALAPVIERCVTELLDAIDPTQPFDFIASFARPLPALVIAASMGIDKAAEADFVAWSDDLAGFIGAPQPTPELARRAQRSLLAMSAYFEGLLARRRNAAPVDDWLGRLVQAEADGQIRTETELLAQCAMLLFAGHETTRHLLGNGLQALLTHPAQWERLCREPELLPAAVRELLRFESPVQYTGRRVTTDIPLHGQTLRRGDLVVALIGAANRDPLRYTAPDTLDIARREGAALSFGRGAHVCIGAALTQMEAEIALRQITWRWPRLQLVDPVPDWNGNAVYRGVSTLRVQSSRR